MTEFRRQAHFLWSVPASYRSSQALVAIGALHDCAALRRTVPASSATARAFMPFPTSSAG